MANIKTKDGVELHWGAGFMLEGYIPQSGSASMEGTTVTALDHEGDTIADAGSDRKTNLTVEALVEVGTVLPDFNEVVAITHTDRPDVLGGSNAPYLCKGWSLSEPNNNFTTVSFTFLAYTAKGVGIVTP